MLFRSWQVPGAEASNGSSPWGVIDEIDLSAAWIWHDTLAASSVTDDNYAIFRTVDALVEAEVVPLPPVLFLMLGGALALLRRRSAAAA